MMPIQYGPAIRPDYMNAQPLTAKTFCFQYGTDSTQETFGASKARDMVHAQLATQLLDHLCQVNTVEHGQFHLNAV